MSTTTMTAQLDQKEKELSNTVSASTSSTLCTFNATNDSSPFYPSRTLIVDARGISCLRLPLPSSQTEITIALADGSTGYVSTRNKRWSGNCILSHPKLGNLIRTDYFFGPNRDPVLRLLQTSGVIPEEVRVSGKWTSRSAFFTMPNGTEYEWAYAKQKGPEGQKLKLIVLEAISMDDNEKITKHRRIAQLVRSSDTRTPGTSRCTAGNGGELQIDDEALHALQLDESIVVATCLVMLKKEIDRRRMIQAAVIAGAGSGS
ncbi:hypothetical protein N7513_013302 [Penicillium frequentans]|nr:hypothetical protein N7513_013302 [Penicillium glabrum]